MEEEKEQKEAVKPPRRIGGLLPFILVLVIVILFVIFTVLYSQKTKETQKGESGKTQEQAQNVFTAVFLTNGQVYFGHLEDAETAYPKLVDVYYLQLRNPQSQQSNITRDQIEQAAKEGVKEEGVKEEDKSKTTPEQTSSESPSQPQQKEQPKLTLVKLGNEIHGPIDSMTINKDHILFTEELKDDSKVVQAIQDYEKKKAEEGQK